MRTDDEEKMQAAMNEYEILSTLKHPSIIEVFEKFNDNLRNTLYTVMEFAPGVTV